MLAVQPVSLADALLFDSPRFLARKRQCLRLPYNSAAFTADLAALTAGVTSAASPGEPPARSPAAKKRASGGRRRPFEEMGEKSQKRARQVAQILDPGLKEVVI